jgi:hypothetical protein
VTTLLAVSEGVIFAIGSVIFIAVFTAALGLAYARFAELGDDDRAAPGIEPTGVRGAR